MKNAVLGGDARLSASAGGPAASAAAPTDHRTRDRVARLLLENGAATAAELGEALGLSPAAIRRHLDAMLADGSVAVRTRPVRGQRGRGRPAKVFVLTEDARLRCGGHAYDDLASSALRWIARRDGPEGVAAFAQSQVAALEEQCRSVLRDAGDDPLARAEALAAALTAQGYAASASTIASGGQLCQHHCPVAHVAAEFPQLCEAETEVISRLVGTHVQRLATIAHGDGVCTTHIPDPRRALPVVSVTSGAPSDSRSAGAVDADAGTAGAVNPGAGTGGAVNPDAGSTGGQPTDNTVDPVRTDR